MACVSGKLCEARACNNNGTCIESLSVRRCECLGGYSGDNCETGMFRTTVFTLRMKNVATQNADVQVNAVR